MTTADVDHNGALSICLCTINQLIKCITDCTHLFIGIGYQELLNTVLNRKLAAKEERYLHYISITHRITCIWCINNDMFDVNDRLWEAFCKFDLDGDGRVTLDEIAAALGDHKEAKELLSEVDKDGDGYTTNSFHVHMMPVC
jgi:Ca2+-binding EF-hand superfamily protein